MLQENESKNEDRVKSEKFNINPYYFYGKAKRRVNGKNDRLHVLKYCTLCSLSLCLNEDPHIYCINLELESYEYFALGDIDSLVLLYHSFKKNEDFSCITKLKIYYRVSSLANKKSFFTFSKKFLQKIKDIKNYNFTSEQKESIEKLEKGLGNNVKDNLDFSEQKLTEVKEKETTDSFSFWISKKWLKDYNEFVKSKFDLKFFPGEIDNYSDLSSKDCWLNKNDTDTEVGRYIPEDKSLYSEIDNNTWENLEKVFGSTNTIKYSNQIKFIKVLILERNLRKNKSYLIKPRYITILPNTTLKTFEKEIRSIICPVDSTIEFRYFKLNFLNEYQRDKFFFDVSLSYTYNSIKFEFFNSDIEERVIDKQDLEKPFVEIFKIDREGYFIIEIEKDKFLEKKNEEPKNSWYKELIKKCLMPDEVMKRIKKENEDNYSDCGMRGMCNLGSTCYLNSALQCISHCPLFRNYFLQQEYKNDDVNETNISLEVEEKPKKEAPLLEDFRQFLEEMWEKSNKAINPSKLREKFVQIEKKFNDHRQHDSPEFFVDFLNTIGKDLNRAKSFQYPLNLNGDKSFENFRTKFYNNENSIVNSLFYGFLDNHYQHHCKCMTKTSSHIYEPFLLLNLQIPTFKFKIIIKVIDSENKHKNEKVTITSTNLNSISVKDIIAQAKKKEDCKYQAIELKNNEELFSSINLLSEEDDVDFSQTNANGSEIVLYKIADISETAVVILDVDPKGKKEKKNSNFFSFVCSCIYTCEDSSVYSSFVVNSYPSICKVEDLKHYPECNNYFFPSEEETPLEENYIMSSFKEENLKDLKEVNGIKYRGILRKDYSKGSFKPSPNPIIENLDIVDCFNCFHTNPYFTKKCKTCETPITLTTSIIQLPIYLCVLFKRFKINNNNEIEKDKRPIKYEETLNIFDFVSKDRYKKEDCNYKLICANVHKGNTNGGHYYAICKVNGKWKIMNDSHVSNGNFYDGDALLLIYQLEKK